jgi:hypothetical protein
MSAWPMMAMAWNNANRFAAFAAIASARCGAANRAVEIARQNGGPRGKSQMSRKLSI